MHYLRRRANIAWSEHDVPSYSYNFDITVNGIPGEFYWAISLSPSPLEARALR